MRYLSVTAPAKHLSPLNLALAPRTGVVFLSVWSISDNLRPVAASEGKGRRMSDRTGAGYPRLAVSRIDQLVHFAAEAAE